MTSIKKNLIKRLSLLIAIALTITYFTSFLNTKKEIQEVFDADLIKSAKILAILIKHESFRKDEAIDSGLQQKVLNRYEYKIHAQAWKKNRIIYNSGESLKLAEPTEEGFKDIELNDKKWRSFTFHDEQSQIKILVLEESEIRNQLISEIILSLLIPLFISFVPLFLIINAIVRKELQPLNLLGLKIKKISTKTLKEFENPQAPKELQPFLTSFNALLIRLSESMESERRFTDYAAHELNTPLTAIKLQAQFLATNKNKEKESEYLQDLINGVNRATHLVDQLLTLARIESDTKIFAKEQFDLAELVKFVSAEYKNKADERNIKINFNCDETSPNLIEAHKTYIEILIRNLVDNALKYSKESEAIEISLSKKNKSLHLKISNKGEKISPEEISQIFKNFYRTNQNDPSSYPTGSGLGLAISKKIVDLHSGVILFKSEEGINSVEVTF